ncbi:MAG: carboxypeptidase-like regulatory domain-containing protein [Muribaculaceae bacterium]|nr:carboxypeptidase-like regulatory domain-containing protein [Muribaculaceae bacterium]
MKFFVTLFLIIIFCIGARCEVDPATTAREVEYYRVVGAVIDVTGNPLPGALVKSKGGMEAVTESDGTFSIFLAPGDDKLTATYPGLRSKKMKVKEQPVVFELQQKPQKTEPLWAVPDVPIKVTTSNGEPNSKSKPIKKR